MDYTRNSPDQNTGVGSLSLLHGIFPIQGLNTDPLPAEPQGKPKNTGVGILSLLQRIFPIQESNQGLLHCWQILYQLSHQGSPCWSEDFPQFHNADILGTLLWEPSRLKWKHERLHWLCSWIQHCTDHSGDITHLMKKREMS